jgi:hypothetical protein
MFIAEEALTLKALLTAIERRLACPGRADCPTLSALPAVLPACLRGGP